jgi:regulator of sigma E protease
MQDFLFSAVAFIVALGVLVTIHEFGHYWVARKVGVKVLRFSVGFGSALWKRVAGADKTEYVIAAIPLGGYVKMLDEREGDVDPAEVSRAFNRQSVWARIAIVLAGPVANLILAVLVYWVVYLIGIAGIAPMVGDPVEDSPVAQAGFLPADRIVAVEGTATGSWDAVRVAVLDNMLDKRDEVTFEVQTESGASTSRVLALDHKALLASQGDVIANLGFQQWWPSVDPIIGGIQPDGAAAAAGLQIGDLIVSTNDEPVPSWRDWVGMIRSNPGQTLQLGIERDGVIQTIELTPGVRAMDDGSEIGFIGAWETQSQSLIDEKVRIVERYSAGDALQRAFVRTWEMMSLTVQMIGKLIMGQAAVENISGPISIAQFAGQSASVGIDHYLSFLALISISLGVLNLLPIPMLDGGHLLYYFTEVVTGKPVSERIQLYGQQLGLLLLAGLMTLAFYNDIVRIIS